MDPGAVVETKRLRIREFTSSDVDLLVELDSDPEVMRFLTGGRPTPRDSIERDVLPGILADYRRWPGFGRWAAHERTEDAFLGWVALRPTSPGTPVTEVELGYRLRRFAWGKGYATEAAAALIDHAFTELGVERIWAQTMAVNNASRRVMERVGLRYVRTFHLQFDDPIDGTEHGEVEYELRRADWNSTLSQP